MNPDEEAKGGADPEIEGQERLGRQGNVCLSDDAIAQQQQQPPANEPAEDAVSDDLPTKPKRGEVLVEDRPLLPVHGSHPRISTEEKATNQRREDPSGVYLCGEEEGQLPASTAEEGLGSEDSPVGEAQDSSAEVNPTADGDLPEKTEKTEVLVEDRPALPHHSSHHGAGEQGTNPEEIMPEDTQHHSSLHGAGEQGTSTIAPEETQSNTSEHGDQQEPSGIYMEYPYMHHPRPKQTQQIQDETQDSLRHSLHSADTLEVPSFHSVGLASMMDMSDATRLAGNLAKDQPAKKPTQDGQLKVSSDHHDSYSSGVSFVPAAEDPAVKKTKTLRPTSPNLDEALPKPLVERHSTAPSEGKGLKRGSRHRRGSTGSAHTVNSKAQQVHPKLRRSWPHRRSSKQEPPPGPPLPNSWHSPSQQTSKGLRLRARAPGALQVSNHEPSSPGSPSGSGRSPKGLRGALHHIRARAAGVVRISGSQSLSPSQKGLRGSGTKKVRNSLTQYELDQLEVTPLDLEGLAAEKSWSPNSKESESKDNASGESEIVVSPEVDPEDGRIDIEYEEDNVPRPPASDDQGSDGDLAVAIPVPTMSQRHLENAEPVDSDKVNKAIAHRKEKEARDRKMLCYGVGVGLVVVIAVVLLVVFLVATDSSDPVGIPKAENTSAATSASPTAAPFIELFPMPNYTRLAIEYFEDSAQAKAYRWLLNDPDLSSYKEWRLVQRFALATIYYATNGENWKFNDNWLNYTADECTWFWTIHSTRSSPCYLDDTVHQRYELLYLKGNDLEGTIPPEVNLLDSLRHIQISFNKLIGTVPPELFEPQYLAMVWLDNNPQLEGTLPTEIGLLTWPENLYFGDTMIQGPLPSELGLLGEMWDFNIVGSRISGAVPSQFGLLSNLKNISLSRVPTLTGTLPTEFGQLSKLRTIYIGNSGLQGPIPSEIGNLPNLKEIAMYENDVTGSLPSQLGLLSSSLEGIWLAGNQISGSLPSELGLLTKLKNLVLDSNDLTGNIPKELMNLTAIEKLDITGNYITGIVPDSICSSVESSAFEFDCSELLCGCDCLCSFSNASAFINTTM